jgi:hypothetical protein
MTMPIDGLVLMLISSLGIIGVAFVRGYGDRRRTTTGALMILAAYGFSVIASKLAAASPIAEGAAAFAILIGIVGVGILVWGLVRDVGRAQWAEPQRPTTRERSWQKGPWMQRLAFAAVFAVIGALTLVLDGTLQKVETGVALFLVFLALSYISTYRKA